MINFSSIQSKIDFRIFIIKWKYILALLILFLLFPGLAICQEDRYDQLVDAALELTRQEVVYDASYYSIPYPGGDIPAGRGVCTDVIIRAYRKIGVDLQKEVHEDMLRDFDAYPNIWGLSGPDTNIDHRRVPNLMVFFKRKGKVLPVSFKAEDYKPGDIVCWNLGGGITHIGLLVNQKSKDEKKWLVVHNIGHGQVLEDILFKFEIIGHFSY